MGQSLSKHIQAHAILGTPTSTGSSGGITEVIHNGTMTGKGTVADPLIVVYPTSTGKLKVSSTDTVYDYLENKIVTSTGISVRTSTGTNGDVLIISNTSVASKPDWSVSLTPKSMNLPATLLPEEITNEDVGGTLIGEALKFDDTLEEYVFGQLDVDPNASGSLTVRITGKPSVPVNTGEDEIQFRLEFCKKTPGEIPASGSWTTTFVSAVLHTDPAGKMDAFTWSDTLANLGIAANDVLWWKLVICHPTPALSHPLVSDWKLYTLKISAPRT